ncbi:NAD-dependent epimerase/dehydratase family protein [Candidatus Kaiserbacteria bacterium]|nr:NAD-dependent epimerase/dehydratase family protein [Candidatus Kaiserbacteria bacterium]
MTKALGPTILVTGGRGFIGSRVVQHLQSRGYDVRALTSDIRTALPSADVIVHCAGRKNDESDSFDVNVNGARNVLKTGAKVINISTAATRLPQKGLYGETKAQAEQILKDHVTLRLGLVYGNEGILETLIRWTRLPIVPVYGEAVFHPIHVQDVAKVVEQSLSWSPGVYDIAGPDGTTLKKLVQDVARIFHEKRVRTLPLPRFLARLYLTESNILGAEQTVSFDRAYGRSLEQGLHDICKETSQ